MSKQIRDSVVIFYFGEGDRFVESVIEAIEVDKVHNILIGIVYLGYFASSYI